MTNLAIASISPDRAPVTSDVPLPRHSIFTRVAHAVLAVAIVAQVGSSQFMKADAPGDWFFAVHEYCGLAAFGLVAAFWALAAFRKRGTPIAMLFPWTSAARMAAVRRDAKAHFLAVMRLRFPRHGGQMPLASAVHGLGLLLMSVMVVSGTVYYFVNTGDPDSGGLVGVTMSVHKLFANLVWVYLIGHAGLAVLAHASHALPLGAMWSFRAGQTGR
jgi:Prokaryotic cytochrome b561